MYGRLLSIRPIPCVLVLIVYCILSIDCINHIYRSPNISIEEYEKEQNAITEMSKQDCIIIMRDVNHTVELYTEYWDYGLTVFFIKYSFPSHVLEPTRGKNVLDIVLSSQKKCVDNVHICDSLGCSDHSQIYVIIKIKGERNRQIRKKIFSHRKM